MAARIDPTNAAGKAAAAAPDAAHAGHERPPLSGAASFSTAYSEAFARAGIRAVHPVGSTAPLNRAHIAPNARSGHVDGHLHERALALRAYRLELLASNIANVDTPGYKAVDIDVEEALLNGTPPGDVTMKFRVPAQLSLDGNTVEMDAERAKFADAAVRYQFSLDQAIRHYMHIADLLKNLKD